VSDEARKCQRCGSAVEGDALFCPRCGQDMTLIGDDSPTLAVTTAGTPVQPVRSTMRQALRDATLGEYEILSELGRGGMATVFLAHDIALDRKVAIKVMAPHLLEGEGMAERFKLEARTAAQLSHPHIIPIYAVKETAETLYFVMKFVEGRGLDAVIKKTGQLPIPMVKDILTKVGNALGYAHRRDVVHRDIKPANIMIDEEGEPIVTDFGIAKVAETKGLTVTGTTIGTPSYMSPEQCEAKPVTGASDQYSLGVVAFEMLTGSLPFEADSAVTTMYKHCHEPPPPLEDFRPDCPTELRDAVNRMLAKDPAERWPSLEAAVRKLSNDPTPTSVDPIRSQLMELMKEGGDTGELLARLSDPSGPVTRRTTGAGAAAAPPRSRTGLYAAIAAGVVAVGGVLVVTQPWAGAAPEPGIDTPAQVAGGNEPAGGVGASGGPSVAGGDAAQPSGGAPSDPPDGDAGDQPAPPVTDPGPAPAGGRTVPANDGGTTDRRGGATAAPALSAVLIEGAPASMEPGQSVTLTALAQDARGATVSSARFTWASSNEDVARVGSDGRLEARAAGTAVITAATGGVTGRVDVAVAAASVASVAVDQATLEMTVGDERTVAAEPRGSDGSRLDGRNVTWESSDPAVATVSAGRVAARGAGTATITATSEGAVARVPVTVRLQTRVAIEQVIERYASALESRDVNQVRSVYPGLTAETTQQLSDALPAMDGLVVDWELQSIDEQGQTASAAVQATYSFRSGGRPQTTPVPLLFEFARSTTGWNLTRIANR